jgi:hypothetical protein
MKMRVRTVRTPRVGSGAACPADSSARECNCLDCPVGGGSGSVRGSGGGVLGVGGVGGGGGSTVKTDLPPVDVAKLKPHAHGFTAAAFTPAGGFASDTGEQAACVLDKAHAVLDLLIGIHICDQWDDGPGAACYPESIRHLARHTEMCCEGREHFVLWKSDLACEKSIAPFLERLREKVQPRFSKCVVRTKGSAQRCSWRWADVQFPLLLHEGTAAARSLYSRGKPGDKTKRAQEALDVCVPERHIVNAGFDPNGPATDVGEDAEHVELAWGAFVKMMSSDERSSHGGDEQGDEGGAMSKFKVQEPPKSCKDYAAKHVAKSMFEYMQQHSKDFGIGKGDTRRLRGGLQF